MLDKLRSSTGGWIAKAFIGLLAASFAVWGIADVFRSSRDDTLATIGKREVSAEEFRREFNRQVRFFARRAGQPITPSQARALGIDRQVLARFLQEGALDGEADRLGLAVSDDLIATRIAANPAFVGAGGRFDADRLRQSLQAAGYSEGEFIASERRNLVRNAIRSIIERGITVPSTLLKAAHKYQSEKRDVSYVIVPASAVAVAEPDDSQMKAYYERNKARFSEPERRSFAVLQVLPKDILKTITVSEDELRDGFERRKSAYILTPEERAVERITFKSKAEAEAARERILKGQSTFEDEARRAGVDAKELAVGNFKQKSFLDRSLANEVFSLPVGRVSKVVEWRLSPALVRVTGITPATTKKLADVRDDLIEKVKLDKAREAILDVHTKVEEARAGGQTLDEIAKSLGLKVRVLKDIARNGADASGKTVDGIAQLSDVLKTVFEGDVGVDTDVIPTKDDGFVWVEIRDVKPAAIPPLAKVKDKVKEALKNDLRIKALRDKLKALRKQAEGGKSLADIAKEVGAAVKTTNGVKRNETNADLDATAVTALFAAPADGYALAVAADGSRGVLMKSTPVFSEPFNTASKEAQDLRKALAKTITDDLMAQFLTALQKDIGVEIDNAVWARLSGGGS